MVDVMPHAVPARSLQQRMEALGRANEIRTTRAEWKRSVKHGVGDVLLPVLRAQDATTRQDRGVENGVYDTMKVYDYLMALPKIGRVKANKWLVQLRISPSKTLGGLSQRQRMELLGYLGPYARRGRIRS